MATVTAGKTFVSGERVTPASLNSLGTPTVTIDVNEVTADKILNGEVTADKLATGAVTGAAGGGKLAASVITAQTQLTDAVASGDEFLVHDASASALRRVAFSSIAPAGSVIQTLQSSTSTRTSITAAAPRDNTALTSSVGTEVLSRAIQPSATANKVLVRAAGWLGATLPAADNYPVVFICRGSTVIQASGLHITNGDRESFFIEYLDSPSSLSTLTYSVRIAVSTPSSGTATVFLCGDGAGERYANASIATLIVQEIKG